MATTGTGAAASAPSAVQTLGQSGPFGAVPTGPPEQNRRSATVRIVSGTIDTSRSASGSDGRRRRGVRRRDPGDRRSPVGRRRPAGHRRPGSAARRGALRGARASSAPDGVIERFITSGIDAETRAGIGSLPRGRGFLGLIIRENRAFRIRDIAADPRRHGFPPNHPDDAQLPRRPGHGPRRIDRQPLPDRQARRRRVLRGRPAARRDVRPPRRDRDRERPRPRAGRAAGGRRRAGADRRRPPRRDHPEPLRGWAVARGRPGARPRRPRRGRTPRRAGDRQLAPDDPGHPQLHLRAAAGAAGRQGPAGRPRRDRGGVPPQLDDRPRARSRRRRRARR